MCRADLGAIKHRRLRQRRGYGEHSPKRDIFEDRDAENNAGEAGMQNFEIIKDARDYRDRGYGDRDPDDQNQCGSLARHSPIMC